MSKLFLFVLLLAVIYYVRRVIQGDEKRNAAASASPKGREVETMSECAHCGLIVPQSEGVEKGSFFFCSSEHAHLGPRNAK